MALVRSTTYAQAVRQIFDAAPGLGIIVHEFVLNGDRLCMHFSEHAAMPGRAGRALTCWRGIGLYKWNGRRLTENYVEQDYFAMRAQIASGQPPWRLGARPDHAVDARLSRGTSAVDSATKGTNP